MIINNNTQSDVEQHAEDEFLQFSCIKLTLPSLFITRMKSMYLILFLLDKNCLSG
ncbi:unnamed protein product, partial [Adineta ricciae]